MPEYVVEAMYPSARDFDQECAFEAPDLDDAIRQVTRHVKSFMARELFIERKHTSATITVQLPFLKPLTYLVGETGRSD